MSESGETTIIDPVILNLAVALGIGLRIAERERRKCSGPVRSPPGERSLLLRLPALSASSSVAR